MRDRYTVSDVESARWPVLWPEGDAAISPVTLDRPVCVVGDQCLVHLPLESSTISKSHAMIVRETDGVYVRDLASKNKTFVNGRPVREAWLNPSDVIQFGPYSFRCHWGFERNAEQSPPTGELWLQPDGLASRQVVSVKQRTFLLGSRRGCDLLLDGDDIALAHAIIFSRDGRRYLRDLSTMAGTLVNGSRIREVALQAGDEIQISSNRLQYYPIEPRVLVGNASAGTVFDFVEDVEAVRGQREPVLEQVNFAEADEPLVASARTDNDALQTQDKILLPWDDLEPIELELADSKVA